LLLLLVLLQICLLALASCALQHLCHATCLGLTVSTWAKLGHATGWVHVLKGCTPWTFCVPVLDLRSKWQKQAPLDISFLFIINTS
jgi:hypothetical protein